MLSKLFLQLLFCPILIWRYPLRPVGARLPRPYDELTLKALLLLLSLIFIDSATAQAPIFVDITEAAGIHFKHSNGKTEHKHIIETMGSGVVFFDYDSDGDADLYFVNSGNHSTK